jgi:DNA-binding response OmpR family regulator
MTSAAEQPSKHVLVYSDNQATRRAVRQALPRDIAVHEVATSQVVEFDVRENDYDLLILDGEAGKFSGMGLGRRLLDELPACPPILLLVARQQDAWLGRWSGANKAIEFPCGPFDIADAVNELLEGATA